MLLHLLFMNYLYWIKTNFGTSVSVIKPWMAPKVYLQTVTQFTYYQRNKEIRGILLQANLIAAKDSILNTLIDFCANNY